MISMLSMAVLDSVWDVRTLPSLRASSGFVNTSAYGGSIGILETGGAISF